MKKFILMLPFFCFFAIVCGNTAAAQSGCIGSATMNIIIEDCTGIDNDAHNSNIRNLFSITPNPADNYLTIQAKTADVWQFVAELQTITGQQIITQHNAQMEQIIWPLANLPAGLYMVILKTPNAYGTEKILITH